MSENLRLNLEIENVKLNIYLDDGFFGIAKNKLILHSHKYYEFHHLISGSMKLTCDNGEYIINPNEAYIVSPNALHYLLPLEEKTLKSSFCFSFSKINRKTNYDLYGMLQSAFSTLDNVTKIPVTSDYIFFLNKILSLFYSEENIDRIKVKTYFLLLLTDVAESLSPAVTVAHEDNDASISEAEARHFVAEEFLRRNFNKNITISDLANTLHLSTKQASRIFYNEFGQSFKDYLANMRLTSAKSLLSETDMSVFEVSENVGYGTYNGFFTMFKAKTGLSPQEYRALFQK